MSTSLKNELYEHLRRNGGWIHGADLEKYGQSLGFMADNVGRRLRDLRKDGSVESELRKGDRSKTAWWKFKDNRPPAVPTSYRVEIINQPLFKREYVYPS